MFSSRTRCFVAGSFLLTVALSGCDSQQKPQPPKSPATEDNSPPVVKNEDVYREKFRDAVIPSQSPRKLTLKPATETDWFRDVTSELGIDFTYRDGSDAGCLQLLESIGGGIAAADFNNDGYEDLFFTGGGSLTKTDPIVVSGLKSAMYWNHGGVSFENVSELSGISDASLYTHGCTVCDLDADGFQDLVVAAYRGIQIWMNQGDGTFHQSAQEFGVNLDQWNITPVAADYNNDGLVDLYLLTYARWEPDINRRCTNDQQLHDICGPTLFSGQRDTLLKNTGTGFVDVTEEVDLVPENRGLGCVAADFDENGHIDFLVVNDVQENLLYNNQDGKFEENGLLAGIAFSRTGEREGSMGVDAGDYDNDGLLDAWYANYTHQDNSLMQNIEKTGFVHREAVTGLVGVSRKWVGFGTGFADFDCDGWEDLYVINGHVAYERLDSPYYQPSQLFKNQQGKKFTEVTDQAGPYFSAHRSGRGSVTVDIDNNGVLDLVVSHQNEPVVVLKNQHSVDNWIRFQLVGISGERSGVGAAVVVTSQEHSLKRWKCGGGSYLSHKDARLLFPLQTNGGTVDVVVTWLGGDQETFKNLETKTTQILQQGRGTDVPN